MSDLDDVVRIVLTRESTAVATASFQIPLVLATFTNFAERTRVYSSFAGVAEDFDNGQPVYEIANQLFGQSTVGAVPPSIIVGRRQVDSVDATVSTVTNNAVYTVTIAGPSSVTPTAFTFTADGTATAIEIATGLKAAYDAAPVTGVTFTDNLDGTFEVLATTPGTNWSITASSGITLVNTATETYVDALDLVSEENDGWYLLVADTQDEVIQEDLSDRVQADRKIYGLSSSDVVAPTTGVTDIGYILNAKSAGRTFGVYLPTAATEYPEAVWAGSQLAYTPGSNDWDFKRGVGATVSKLNATQLTNLKNKSWNHYIQKGGVNIFMDGNMFDKTPIDQVIVEDWLYARLQESIYFRIINSLKIPMTNPGLLRIENEIRSVLSQAEANGAIDRGWTVTSPDVLSIPENLRAQRVAAVFVFRCRLAGSIRKVEINGFLSV
jgi:hypothetical protein